MNDSNKVDEKISWFKNHPVWSWIIFLGIAIVAIGSLSSAFINIDKIVDGIGSDSLEISTIRLTDDFELDIVLRNKSQDSIVISRLSLTLKQDKGIFLPIINPSAIYEISIDDLNIGETKSLNVSHLIKPKDAERILISLNTTRNVDLELSIQYNEGNELKKYISLEDTISGKINDPVDRVTQEFGALKKLQRISFITIDSKDAQRLNIDEQFVKIYNQNLDEINIIHEDIVSSFEDEPISQKLYLTTFNVISSDAELESANKILIVIEKLTDQVWSES